jgi:hypothetical protein
MATKGEEMRVRAHLSYANVMATVAVFGVVAGGGAYAASKIGTRDLQPKAVTAPKIDKAAVTGGKVRDGAVGTESLSQDARGVALVGATISKNGAVLTYFNRTGGGPPRVEGGSPGLRRLYFPGLENYNFGRAIQSATILDDGYIGSEISISTAACSGPCVHHPFVVTHDSAGAPADRAFSYVLFDTEGLEL